MNDHWRGLRSGLLGGAIGLVAMSLAKRLSAPLTTQPKPKPTDVFLSERTMSPLGATHKPGESATAAVGRIGYQALVGETPSKPVTKALSWGVHIGYGLLVAGMYGLIRGSSKIRRVRDGLWFGTGLWLVGDELVVPLLGLADKPTAYHPTRHVQSLFSHLGFGAATAGTARVLEELR